MKHLFLVHSPITYLTSVAVINELKISKDDAIIIFFEFEKVIQENEQYKSVSINELYPKKNLLKRLFNYCNHFNIITRIDRLVNKTINNDKFVAYVPVLIFAGKALITHPNCCSFNFIEEGLAHYYKEETLHTLTVNNSKDPWRSSVFKNVKTVLTELYFILRGYNFKLQALPFSYSCYNSFKNVNFFGLSEDAFPLSDKPKKIIVPFVKNSFQSIRQSYNIDLDNKTIWIGDGSITQHGFSPNIYLQGIKKGCIDFVRKKGKQDILIKFHRDEPKSLRQSVKKLFYDHDISIQVIPDGVIMELLLFHAKNVTLVGVYSSLLFYASLMGHRSFSIYKFLEKEYSTIFENRDFSFYWEKVSLINYSSTTQLEN